jgi:hypothetical protein
MVIDIGTGFDVKCMIFWKTRICEEKKSALFPNINFHENLFRSFTLLPAEAMKSFYNFSLQTG